MHVPNLILVPFLLSLCAIISASPASPPSNGPDNLVLVSPQILNATSPSTHTLNTTTPILPSTSSISKRTICYGPGHRSPPIDTLLCFPLIEFLATRHDFYKPVKWKVSAAQGRHLKMRGCQLQIVDGATDDVFSAAEVLEAMEAVLEECQPEVDREAGGTGGQKGVGRYGFVVRVVGARRGGVEGG